MRPAFSTGQGLVRSGASIHGFRGQDHELPDRSLRCLRFAPRSRVHRSRTVSSEAMDRRSRSPGSRIRACDTGFATKPKLATAMIARAIAASVPFKWVAADTVYGVGDIEQQLRQAAKAMCLGSAALMCFNPGVSGGQSPAPPRTSPRRGVRPTGNACRRDGPKDRGCMIGAISNWPISMSKNLTAQIKVFGHAVC